MQTISFNTGRTYTQQGQRIAATKLESGHIVMLDIDRHIDVLIPAQVDLTQRDIMWAYDNNIQVYPSNIDLSYGDYYEVVNSLRSVAESVSSV